MLMSIRTMNGTLRFDEFAELVSSMFREAHPNIAFYQEGSPVDDVVYPVIVWRNAERTPATSETGTRPKLIETLHDDATGAAYTRRIRVTRNVFRLTVKAENPEQASQIADLVEDFVEEVTGALMKMGIKRIIYAGRHDLDVESDNGKTVNRRLIEWVVHEERATVIKESTIEKVEMLLKAVTEEGEGEEYVSSSSLL